MIIYSCRRNEFNTDRQMLESKINRMINTYLYYNNNNNNYNSDCTKRGDEQRRSLTTAVNVRM